MRVLSYFNTEAAFLSSLDSSAWMSSVRMVSVSVFADPTEIEEKNCFVFVILMKSVKKELKNSYWISFALSSTMHALRYCVICIMMKSLCFIIEDTFSVLWKASFKKCTAFSFMLMSLSWSFKKFYFMSFTCSSSTGATIADFMSSVCVCVCVIFILVDERYIKCVPLLALLIN